MRASLEDIWLYAMRVSGAPAELAHRCGVAVDDPGFVETIRAMVTSGFLKPNARGGYDPGQRPPPGPVMCDSPQGAQPVVSAPLDAGVQAPRPPPAGVPDTGDQPAPAAAAEVLPDNLHRVDGRIQVVDERADRVAKSELMEHFDPLLQWAKAIREQLDNDTLEKDVDDLLDDAIAKIENAASEMGYGTIGHVGMVQPYDPELHRYCGKLPSTGMTHHVVLASEGQTFTHRGRLFVLQAAYVDLHDADFGRFSINEAGDWIHEDGSDPEIWLIVQPGDTYKPENYAGEDDHEHYRVKQAFPSRDVYADCEQATCSHPKDDEGRCDMVAFMIEDASRHLFIPSGALIMTCMTDYGE